MGGFGAVLEGIHAEGPVVESLGGLPPGDSDMGPAAFLKFLDMLGPALKIMTIAPSREAKSKPPFQRLKALLSRGIRPALGHDTACTVEDVASVLRHVAH